VGVCALLCCEDCKVHLHIGKFKSNPERITDESLGLIHEFLLLHEWHTLRLVSDATERYDYGTEWRGD